MSFPAVVLNALHGFQQFPIWGSNRGWDMLGEDVGSRELPSSPMEGFTAFLDRDTPRPNPVRMLKLEIALRLQDREKYPILVALYAPLSKIMAD